MMTTKITCDRESKLTLLAIFHFSRIWASWNINAAWGRKKKPTVYTVGPISPRTVPGTGRAAGGPLSPLMTSSSLYNTNSAVQHRAGLGKHKQNPISTSHGIAVSAAYDVLIRACQRSTARHTGNNFMEDILQNNTIRNTTTTTKKKYRY